MADQIITGDGSDNAFTLDLLNLTGATTIDGGAGIDRVTLALHEPNVPALRVRIDLTSGQVWRIDADGNATLQPVTLRNIESLYGSKGWDPEFIGNAGDNDLSVGIAAFGGRLVGGASNDRLEGDTVDYSRMAGPVVASIGAGVATSVDGTDTLVHVLNLIGSGFDDRLEGSRNANLLEGGPGNDTLAGVLNEFGGGDAASYAHAAGPVAVSLASGRASGADGNDVLTNIARLVGSAFDDSLEGSVGAEALDGSAGSDTLRGGEGNDTLTGGPGNDLVDGGPGVDTASFEAAAAAVWVSLEDGWAWGTATGADTLAGTERISGSALADLLAGSSGGDLLDGHGGADTLLGADGNDTLQGGALLDGGNGNDLLAVRYQVDGVTPALFGGAGNDTLAGGGVLDGGPGSDLLQLDGGFAQGARAPTPSSAISVDGGDGFDIVQMLPDLAADSIGHVSLAVTIDLARAEVRIGNLAAQHVSFRGIEALYDSKGWDATFIGDDQANIFRGDTVYGGGGNDIALGGGFFDGGSGTDTYRASAPRSNYTLGRSGDVMTLSHVVTSAFARVESVERIVFADQALAFGDRALDVARIAFALWSPAIVVSPALFGKGVDWYDQGHSFDEAVRYALSFFAGETDAQLAQQLASHVPGAGRSAAELQALIASHGGGLDGRAWVTALMANDAANLTQVELAGFPAAGIACSLSWGSEALFVMPGPSGS